MKKIWVFLLTLGLTIPALAAAQLNVLRGAQGGTNIGSATSGDIGSCLKIASVSPTLVWEIGTCGGSGTGSPGGSNTQVQFNDSGDFGGDSGFTYDKTNDLATIVHLLLTGSSTLQAFTFTNATGSQATTTNLFSTNLFGTTGNITNLTVPGLTASRLVATDANKLLTSTITSANLAASISNETGTGLVVFATNPVLTTPNLGTPSAVTLTNGTGLPISTGVSGLGTGVATFLGTPSSANLASALTDKTGTGAVVFSDAPTFTGVANFADLIATNATATNISISNNASTTNLYGANLTTCNSATNALTWSGGKFGCNTISSSSGSGNVATSSPETSGRIPFWDSTNATPATLSGGVAGFAFDSTLTKLTVTNASTTNLSIGALSGILKQSSGVVSAAANGTDYTLITGTTCSGNDKVSAISASGSVTCSTDVTGSGGAGLATSTNIADTWVIYGTSASDVGAEAAFTYDDATNILSADHYLANSSSTLQNFTFVNATGSAATTTNFFSTIASTSNLYLAIGACSGSSAVTINSSGKAVCGTLAPTAGSITGAGDITRTNDTNVTLTLVGTPTGATLNDVSFTLGWTGTLADSRVADNLTISGGTIDNSPIGASTPSTGIFTNATSTTLSTTKASTTDLWVSNVASALVLTDSAGKAGKYAGTSCTNQFPRSLSATGNATCATVANTDLANSTVSYGGVTLSLGGSDATPAFDLTDATNLPISTGVSGLAAGIATFLGTPSSANLASAVTNETGSGLLVFATSPTLTTPNLGTPSAVTLTNGTGLPISGLTGLGTGVGTFLGTPSSANLASALTDETGTGSSVFSASPTFTGTVLGASLFFNGTSTIGGGTDLTGLTIFGGSTTTGKAIGTDKTNNWTGRISPTRSFVLQTGTTTAWTASTTGTAYSPFIAMPYAGTLRDVACFTDTGTLGINVKVNGSNATPSFITASTTAGFTGFTAGNTFSKGQKILMDVGTPASSPSSISCTFDITETP